MGILYVQKLPPRTGYVPIPLGAWIDTPKVVVLNNELYVVGIKAETGRKEDDELIRKSNSTDTEYEDITVSPALPEYSL